MFRSTIKSLVAFCTTHTHSHIRRFHCESFKSQAKAVGVPSMCSFAVSFFFFEFCKEFFTCFTSTLSLSVSHSAGPCACHHCDKSRVALTWINDFRNFNLRNNCKRFFIFRSLLNCYYRSEKKFWIMKFGHRKFVLAASNLFALIRIHRVFVEKMWKQCDWLIYESFCLRTENELNIDFVFCLHSPSEFRNAFDSFPLHRLASVFASNNFNYFDLSCIFRTIHRINSDIIFM